MIINDENYCNQLMMVFIRHRACERRDLA